MRRVLFSIFVMISGCSDEWKHEYECSDYELERVDQAYEEAYHFESEIQQQLEEMMGDQIPRVTVLERIMAVEDFEITCAYFADDAPSRAQVYKAEKRLVLPVAENIEPFFDPTIITEDDIDECYWGGGREFMETYYPRYSIRCTHAVNWGMHCTWSCPLIAQMVSGTSSTANLVSDIVHEGGHVSLPGMAHTCEVPVVSMLDCPSGNVVEDEILVGGTAAGVEVQDFMVAAGNEISQMIETRYLAEQE